MNPERSAPSVQIRVPADAHAVLTRLARYLSAVRNEDVSVGAVVSAALDTYIADNPALSAEVAKVAAQ